MKLLFQLLLITVALSCSTETDNSIVRGGEIKTSWNSSFIKIQKSVELWNVDLNSDYKISDDKLEIYLTYVDSVEFYSDEQSNFVIANAIFAKNKELLSGFNQVDIIFHYPYHKVYFRCPMDSNSQSRDFFASELHLRDVIISLKSFSPSEIKFFKSVVGQLTGNLDLKTRSSYWDVLRHFSIYRYTGYSNSEKEALLFLEMGGYVNAVKHDLELRNEILNTLQKILTINYLDSKVIEGSLDEIGQYFNTIEIPPSTTQKEG